MARTLNPPRTAFHRRMQGMTQELEKGFIQVNDGFHAIYHRLETDLLTMNDHLGKLTMAVKDIPSSPDVLLQVLQVNVLVLLGDSPWQMIAVDAKEPLRRAAEQMRKHDIGTMLVTEGNRLVGMVSSTQIVSAVRDNSLDIPLKQCMVIRKDFHCIKRGDTVGEAIRQFQNHPVKRLIVVNERNQVCGILTLGRLLRWFAERILTQNASGV